MPTLSVNDVVQVLFKFQLTAFLCFACMAIWSLWSPFMFHSTLILLPYVAHPLFFITLTGPAFLSVRFSLGIQYMLLRLCEWEKDREIIRERTQRPFPLSHSRVAFSVLSFVLLMLERHSLPSPPKEPHVFGQSGGVMHECMALSPPVVNWTHLMLCYCYYINQYCLLKICFPTKLIIILFNIHFYRRTYIAFIF